MFYHELRSDFLTQKGYHHKHDNPQHNDENNGTEKGLIDTSELLEDKIRTESENTIPRHRIKRRKRYTNAYGLFFQELYRQSMKTNRRTNFSETSRFIASEWRKLNEAQKKTYRDMVNKKKYSTNYGTFFHTHYDSVRKATPNGSFGAISSKISSLWDGLSRNEKKAYGGKKNINFKQKEEQKFVSND